MICTLPGEISCSIAVSSSSRFSWLLLGSLPLLNSHLGCYTEIPCFPRCFLPRFFEACLLSPSRQLPDVGSHERYEQGYQPRLCSARLGNSARCVTGFRLCNGIPGYAINHPDGIPESSPVRLLNRLTKC